MGKVTIILMCMSFTLNAELLHNEEQKLEENCLSCHKQQQIPSSLIYKRYLMKYSVKERIEDAMFFYLKDPKKSISIMPTQFFLKFPMKEKMTLDDIKLKKAIQAYLEKYDIRKKLVLEK